MDVYEAMEKRYSVRSYQDREVEQEALERVLTAGRIARSATNAQEWKFVVAQSGELIAAIAKVADQPFLAEAPVIVAAVATNPDRLMHCGVASGPVDCAIALDHMTLAAVAEGLGTCWIGHFDQQACCELLGVDESARIIELLPLGYPAAPDEAEKTKNRKKLDEVVCYEKFTR